MSIFPIDKCIVIKGNNDIDITGDGVYVLEFWASWCMPCVRNIHKITELQKKYPNVRFIGLTRETPDRVVPFVERMGQKMEYTVVADPESISSPWFDEYNITGIPHAMVIHNKEVIYNGHPLSPEFETILSQFK